MSLRKKLEWDPSPNVNVKQRVGDVLWGLISLVHSSQPLEEENNFGTVNGQRSTVYATLDNLFQAEG